MKIAIATVQVPFIKGGAEILVRLLKDELIKRGHSVEIVTIPFKWYPARTLLNCMIMGRLIDLSEVNGEKIELVIAMKFPAYYLNHENKVLWLMHQHRQAYDLWGTEHSDLCSWRDAEFIRGTIKKNDDIYLREAKRTYTISQNTANRLNKYNNIDSIALYHPPENHDLLHCKRYENFIFYPSRIDKMKRQRLVVQAARHLKSDVKIYLAGRGSIKEINYLKELIEKYDLQNRVKLLGYISEEEKIDYYSRCLAVYFGAYNEDYGYVTLEAFYSRKPVIVHKDAGGPLEFVIDNHNGFVIEDAEEKLSNTIDNLVNSNGLPQKMGETGYRTIIEKDINWDFTIKQLLGENTD